MKIKYKKRGIAMLSLVIVILVLLMLSGIVTYVGFDMMAEGKKTAFLHDVEVVSNAVEEYYAVNGSLPILDNGVVVTVSEYKENVKDMYDKETQDNLAEEILQSGDEEATFYEIDITKLNVETSKFGLKTEQTDIFLLSSNNNVYYYEGYEISDVIYFSASKIMDKLR